MWRERIAFCLVWLVVLPFRTLSEESLGCTALAVDGAASVTGAAYAVENTDCNNCDFRLNYVPARRHETGAERRVYMNPPAYPRYVGYGRGSMYHPRQGQNLSIPIGSIPEVSHTYGYYESISPLMNEVGLGIGESSCGAMLQNKQPGSSDPRAVPIGIIDAMTMMQLALERCATARCAVVVMGELAEKHGYLPYGGEPTKQLVYSDGRSTFADSGEAYTIADASGEAWMFNVMGGVDGIVKSVWAAQKVPKGHVAVVANEFTMGEIPPEPTEEFLYCKDIFRAAKAAGLWDGKGALDFTKVFAPDPTMYGAGSTPPIPLYSSLRRWRLMSLVAPSMDLKLLLDHRKYPFSVKVERPLSHRDVMELMRDHYGGTEFDMTQGILAGPYGTPFRPEGGPSAIGDMPRGISILRTLYSTITQTGPGGSVLWYASDTPATSVYIPLDPRTQGGVSPAYAEGHNRMFNRSSAWWAFNFVNNWMQLNYKGMSTEDVLPKMQAWQDKIDKERPLAANSGVDSLRDWQMALQEEVVADWQKLADFLVMKWLDMRRSTENVTAGAVGYPEWWARMIGYSYDIHPIWVQPAEKPPEDPVPGYVSPSFALPHTFDVGSARWNYEAPESEDALASSGPGAHLRQGYVQLFWSICILLVGFWLGRLQRRVSDPRAYVALGY